MKHHSLVGPHSLGGAVGQKHMEGLRGVMISRTVQSARLGEWGDQCGLGWSGKVQGESGFTVPH